MILIKLNKYRDCLLGGAIGDALGYPVEFLKINDIKKRYGEKGIEELELDETGIALISDDTQMTLFTADGLLWAYERMTERGIGNFVDSGIYPSYLRWLYTQCGMIGNKFYLEIQNHESNGRTIFEQKELFVNREAGSTCLHSLLSGEVGRIENKINDSKGCGGVMRIAPIGLFLHHNSKMAFQIGCEAASITHSHPTGYLTGGALAEIIARLCLGEKLIDSIRSAILTLVTYKGHEETVNALSKAIELANMGEANSDKVALLGQGWIAEETLSIAIYCALVYENDFRSALRFAVNHDGDSDSTGAICGNILGVIHGKSELPTEWISDLKLAGFIGFMSDRLYDKTPNNV